MKATLACAQFAPAGGGIQENIGHIRTLVREAARRGAAVLLLPELSLCGYPSADQARSWAVRTDGPEMSRLAECARENRLALCLGFAELAPNGILHNSAAYIDRAGSLRSVYRKVHLWVTEKEWAQPGNGFQVVVDSGIPLGMWICYDTRFPETARTLARSGTKLGLAGSAWFGPPDEWELAVRARAVDNGIFVAGATLLGSFGSSPFRGTSLVADPHGRVLARAREGVEEVICAEYDDAVVQSFHDRVPLLDHLRPEAYA